MEVEVINFYGGKVEFFGIKFQMERDNGFEFVLEYLELQVVVLVCSDFDVMRVLYDNEVEFRS